MNKKLVVKQDGYKECGAACLLSIIRYYGGNISINKLLDLTNTSKTGTTFFNLKDASSKLGLDATGFKIEDTNKKESLQKINMPSICQIVENNYEHFIVIYKVKKEKILIMDPARGYRTIKNDEFFRIWTGYIMTFVKTTQLPYLSDEKYLNKLIIELLIKNKGIVLNIVILSIIFTIISSIYAMYSGFIIDTITSTNTSQLIIITEIFITTLIIKSISDFSRNKLLIYLNQKLDCTIFLNSIRKIILLPYSYYKNRTTGEIISKLNDLANIKNMLSKIILTVFLDVIVSLTCAIVMMKINIKMFLILVVTILIYILIFLIFRPLIKKYTNINQENNAKINSQMVELINGFETIKNLSLENIMYQNFSELYTKSLHDVYIYDNINNYEFIIKELITYLTLLLTEFIGFYFVLHNTLTIGEIIIFTSLAPYFMSPIRSIIDLSKEYFYAINSLKRANNLLEIKSDDLNTKTTFTLNGNINIKNLSFSYNNYDEVLKGININIAKGDKILILGNSGSGKSTIIKILSKYYTPRRDSIYIDGTDINDISISNLKDNITTISQEEIIFNDTIKNNIILNRKISDNKFIKICRELCIDEFVKNSPMGYNTKLEENGQNISGGQRQRIILARALLKNSNILLIDEGLNAIDINLERKILKTIFEKYQDKTIIIVSHRLENMDLYKKVINLKDGKIDKIANLPKEGDYYV